MDDLDKLRAALPEGFTVDGQCGAGAQGSVFRGTFQGQAAALKVFSPDTEREVERIRREVAALQGEGHPSLVRLLHAVEIGIDGAMYPLLAYEYHGGGEAAQLLDPASPVIAEAELCVFGEQIGGAVESLWTKRIVHRDIKPTNIVRAENGRWILVDIGIARHLDLRSLTVRDGVLGTRGYMSPEQAQGRRFLTINSDIFSLGVTIFVLATKAHPFNNAQQEIGRRAPNSLKEARPDLSDNFVQLVQSMMSITPAERPVPVSERFARIKG